jgi:hypothetical protein
MKSAALKFSLLISLLFMTVAGGAEAKTYKSKKGQCEVTIPDTWKVAGAKDVMILAATPDDKLGLLFLIVDSAKAEDAIKALDKELGPEFKDQKWGKPKAIELNGMKGIVMDGTAKDKKGVAVELSLVVLGTPAGNGLILFGGAEAKYRKSHEAEILEILKSLKPSK